MDYVTLTKKLVKDCLDKGANQAEVYLESGRNLRIEVRNGEIETVQEAASHGAGFRVFVRGRMAFASCNDFSDSALENAIDKAIGFAGSLSKNRRNYLRQAGLIVALEKDFRHLSDSKLSGLINQLHECFRCGRDTIEDRSQALAIVCEVAYRQIGLRPFAVQIAGALAIEDGCIAEMATGEGKTLVAAMPAVLAGWRGRGCRAERGSRGCRGALEIAQVGDH